MCEELDCLLWVVIRTDFIALCCIALIRNLQGLPKLLNGHPRLSEQNLLPQNMIWRTRQASRPPGDTTLEGPRIRPHQDFPAQTRPHQTPHHRGREGTPHLGGGDSHPQHPTPQGEKEGPTHQTPHHREGEGEGIPINPTTTSQTIAGVGTYATPCPNPLWNHLANSAPKYQPKNPKISIPKPRYTHMPNINP